MDLTALLNEIKALREDITKSTKSELEDIVKDLTAKIDELSKEKDAIKDEVGMVKEVKEALDGIKSELEGIKGVSDEIKGLKEAVETLKAELEEVKNAKPKVEVPEIDEKTFEDNIDKYLNVWMEAKLLKKDFKDTTSFNLLDERLKAVNLDSTFTTKVSKRFLEDVRNKSFIADLLQDYTREMAGATSLELPFYPDVSANWGSLTLSDIDLTTKVTLTKKTLVAGVKFSYVSEEESLINWLNKVRDKLAYSIAQALDQGILGKTAITNGIVGMLKYCEDSGFLYTDPDTGNVLTANKLWKLRAVLGKYANNPQECVIVLNTTKAVELMEDSNLLTTDKLGDQAVLLKGQIGSIFGVPVVINDNCPLSSVDAAGEYSALMFNRNFFAIAFGDINVKMDDYVEELNKVIVASTRVAFSPLVPVSSTIIDSNYPIIGAISNA